MQCFRLSLSCLFVTLGFVAWLPSAAAQDDFPEPAVEGRLVMSEAGFSIDLAGGFQLAKQQAGYYLLGSNTIPGLILIKPLEALSEAELGRAIQSGHHDGTVDLIPLGEVVEAEAGDGAGKIVEVRGELNGGAVHGLLGGYLRSAGGGLLLFAVTAPGQWPELEPTATQMAGSVRLFEPDPQHLIDSWRGRLEGFRLLHLPDGETSDLGAADRIYSLCPDGRLVYEHVPEGGGEEARRSESGRWRIEAERRRVTLRLEIDGGEEQLFLLGTEDHKTYLDGTRHFVLPSEHCR